MNILNSTIHGAPQKPNRFECICQVFILAFFALTPFQLQAQYSLNFSCGIGSSVDAAMIGTSDSVDATVIIPGDTSLIDSILVEIVVKGNPVFWGSTTVTTSAGEVVVIAFPGLITNTGSNEEAAIYRAWVGPCQSIHATTPVADPLHYDDWQSMTTFQIRDDFDCLSGTSSDGDILLFHACDTFFFDIDSIIAPFKDVSIIAPISEIGDADTVRSAIIEVNYIHNGVVTLVSIDTFTGPDNLGDNALLYENVFSVPGNVDSIEVIFISPDGVFSNTSCTQQIPFGGDSFVVSTVVVSSACDECCTVVTNCDTLPDNYVCAFDLIPLIPAVLLDSIVMYSGGINLDSLAFIELGGTYSVSLCDTLYIIASDDSTGAGCPDDTGYVFRAFEFHSLSTGELVGICEFTYVVLDSMSPIITCPSDTTLQCNSEDFLPYQTLSLFIAAGGSASDDCALDESSFTLISELSDGLTCPETITRTYGVADNCGNFATCVQLITLIDTIPPSLTCPDDITLECFDGTDPESTGFAIVSDDCDSEPSLTYSDILVPGICQVEFTIARTWTVVDDCGNVTTCVQTIVVDDSDAPLLTVP
ncbi:MAG TPA: hypothetical protein VI603_09935, partial [Saprospiraceae bacterium]|nr:hypothetical protein [Saprospiraceae bacterium]